MEKDEFIELLYAALVSWDMNARGAKMEYFDKFKKNIQKNKNYFKDLSKYKLERINESDFLKIKNILEKLYDNLYVMKSKAKLVSNSKLMHFILPDLVMPMDGSHILNFFFGNVAESKNKFLDIFECSYQIAKAINLKNFLDKEWNQSVPKVIDNAIISEHSTRYRLK